MSTIEKWFRANQTLCVLVLLLTSFCTSYFSVVSYATSDPKGSLLLSKVMLEQGTFELDAHMDEIAEVMKEKNLPEDRLNTIFEKNGHYYYYYPIGTSVFSLPFVWLASLRGDDPLPFTAADEGIQNWLSALSTAAAWLLVYMTCRIYLDVSNSFLLSVAFVFGSSLMSTMGTALWSSNFTVLFLLGSLLILLKSDPGRPYLVSSVLLGVMLFSAFLCRPTASLFVPLALGYVFFRKERRMAYTAAGSFAVLLVLFVIVSWREFGQLLPDYYLPGRLSEAGTFWLAVYGNLVSPARGLLVYSPYLLLTFVGLAACFKDLRAERLVWLAGGWFVLHLVVISRFSHWWAGWSFGNRLFTDAFPALILLTVLVWRRVLTGAGTALRRTVTAVFIVLGLVSIFINTYQGLYNQYPALWNGNPDINTYTAHLFDWRHPQFLASPRLLKARELDYRAREFAPCAIGDTIGPRSENVVFCNWHDVERLADGRTFRWSKGTVAELLFRLRAAERDEQGRLVLEMRLGAYGGAQEIEVYLNDRFLEALRIEGFEPSVHEIDVERGWLDYEDYNAVRLRIPGASSPSAAGEPDTRVLGIAFWEAAIVGGRGQGAARAAEVGAGQAAEIGAVAGLARLGDVVAADRRSAAVDLAVDLVLGGLKPVPGISRRASLGGPGDGRSPSDRGRCRTAEKCPTPMDFVRHYTRITPRRGPLAIIDQPGHSRCRGLKTRPEPLSTTPSPSRAGTSRTRTT